MSDQLMREMFEYFASLARLDVKQNVSIDQWKVDDISPHYVYLAALPKHELVSTFLSEDSELDPGVAVSVERPDLPEPPDPRTRVVPLGGNQPDSVRAHVVETCPASFGTRRRRRMGRGGRSGGGPLRSVPFEVAPRVRSRQTRA